MSIIKGTNQIVAGFGGTKRSIGEVYFSQSALATDNSGALPLFTGETIASANTIYPEFYNWVLAHTELQCTSAEYESALTTYGECAKYVIGSGSLRLPLIKNYIKAANTSDGIKNIEAGLPNIIGGFTLDTSNGIKVLRQDQVYGAFNLDDVSNSEAFLNASSTGSVNKSRSRSVKIDASRSSAVYGKSDTVTPASTTLYPWVVAYTAAIPASTAQAAEFQQALSGKANTDLSNVSSTVKASLLDLLAMDTTRGVSLPSGTTLTQNGWIVCSFTDNNYGVAQFQLDGVTTFQWSFQSAANTRKGTCYGGKGQVFTITTSGNCTAVATFYPLKGD